MDEPKRRTVVPWVVAALALVAVIIFLTQGRNPVVDPGPVGPDGTPLDLAKIAAERNQGIAYLENQLWTESEQLFEGLAALLPDEILPARNLAIARSREYLAIDPKQVVDQAEYDAIRTAAVEAIESLRTLEPDSQYSYRLQSRIVDPTDQLNEKLTLLEEAIARAPEDASLYFEYQQSTQVSRDEALTKKAYDAISKAYELAPDNVFLAWNYLLAQMDQQDPSIVNTLNRFRPFLVEFQKRFERTKQPYNMLDFSDAAVAAVQKGDWATVRRNVRPLTNFLKTDDISRGDHRRIELDSLEFVVDRFSDNLEIALEKLQAASEPPAEFKFEQVGTLPQFEGQIQSFQIVDIDFDSRLDLLVLTEQLFAVCVRNAASAEWSIKTSIQLDTVSDDFLVADLDLDADELAAGSDDNRGFRYTADLDLVLYGNNGVAIYRTELQSAGGEIKFDKIEIAPELADLKDVARVIAGDMNSDGDLDLNLIANGEVSYWNNNSNFEFVRIPFLGDPPPSAAVDLVAVDWDRDIDQDLVVLLEDGTLGDFEGLRHGDFRWQSFDKAASIAEPDSLTIHDVDRNGSWDLTVSGQGGIEVFRTRIPEMGEVQIIDAQQIAATANGRLIDCDFNLDGYRDLTSVEAGQVMLRLGTNQGKFADPVAVGDSNAVASFRWGDLTQSGHFDAAILTDAGLQVLMNSDSTKPNWSDIAIIADLNKDKNSQSQRINHFGIGGYIESRSGPNYQLQLVSQPGPIRFGLGDQSSVDAIRVVFPNGIPQNIIDPSLNQVVFEKQTLLGSCPYLYAWNGERFEFVTDLLWAAPIGLVDAHGHVVPDRPWEYLKVSGEQLQPRDGTYQVQVTEELWEAAYFDQLELIAIDHPADIDVFTNEKVGPPAIAEHRLYGVRERHQPVAADNQAGRSILEEVSTRDENYAVPFEKKLMQGYVEETHIDLDFGLTEKPEHLTLFLTGWIFPTDVGINRALFENQQLDGPRPPSISVIDKDGQFKEVIDYCGFPGGKTKTIAIELSDIFLTDDYRIRLSTSMELYWDEIFVSTDPTNVEFVATPLEMTAADLHYRGVSTKSPDPNNGPERYDYDQVDPTPAWNEMAGQFTRFGDVLPLLTETDHQLAVIGTGDEITLQFQVPDTPIPDGWTRDFVLHCVGWDKDANLHTVYGQTVEPLPYVGMPSYPPPPEVTPPHAERYFEEYQNRRFDPNGFVRAFRSEQLKRLRKNQ